MNSAIRLLCFGLGYSARVLAAQLGREDAQITGTSRSAEGTAAITAAGWTGLVFDGTVASDAVRAAIAASTHILLSIPPSVDGDPALLRHGADIARAEHLTWIGYLSTVGVYGDHQGRSVDEETPPAPHSERGRRRLTAENGWTEFARPSQKRVVVFRLPGIYGPGRSAIDAVRAGTARRIIKKGQVFNRIHVADIATAVAASMHGRGRHGLYNVSDDEPAPPEDVVLYAATLLGVPPPPAIPFETADLSPMARSFYGESKRVSNTRLRQDLGIDLAYPTYREGLKSLLATKT